MKIKYFKTPVVFLVIVILLCGQEGNSKAAIKGIKNYAVQDDTAGIIQHLSTLIQNSDNTLFANHCNSIINVFRKEEQITNYEVKFDGNNLCRGVYFYRIKAGKFSETKKFLLLK